jgi:NAD(P)-dependent dehydrogenase (short-subunit alcohol dehydrogenase family)
VNTLLEQGAHVLGVDLSPSPKLDHERFCFIQQDITEDSAPSKIISECVNAFNGRIDALFNVAGVLDGFASVETVSDSLWNRVIAVNLTAPVRLMREVLPIMKKQKKGSIVNVSSIAGLSAAVAGVAYTTAKHGLVSPFLLTHRTYIYFQFSKPPQKILHGSSGTRVYAAMQSVLEVRRFRSFALYA